MWVCVDVARAKGFRKGRKEDRQTERMEEEVKKNIIVLYLLL